MPIYEFVCRDCQKPFEIDRPINQFDPKAVECPTCQSKRVERVWSSVFAITSKKS
jgi:putative FmdB family regulatory protein